MLIQRIRGERRCAQEPCRHAHNEDWPQHEERSRRVNEVVWDFNKPDTTTALPTDQFKGNVISIFPPIPPCASASVVNANLLRTTTWPPLFLGRDEEYTHDNTNATTEGDELFGDEFVQITPPRDFVVPYACKLKMSESKM